MSLFLRNAPLVRVVIPFVMGLTTFFFCGSNADLEAFFFITIVLSLIAMIALKKQWKNRQRNSLYGVLSSAMFLSLGFIFGGISNKGVSIELKNSNTYIATIESVPVEKERSYALNLRLFAGGADSSVNFSCNSRVVGYFHKATFDQSLLPGESILFKGYFSTEPSILYPEEFDYFEYLKRKGYDGTVYVPKGGFQRVDESEFTVKAFLNNLRWKLIERLNNYAGDRKEFGVIAALVLGDRSYLDPKLRSDFATAGVVHILAVSGLHVGIIFLLFSSLFDRILRTKGSLLKLMLVLIVLWTYAGLTGFSPSVLRAATMFSFISLGKYHNKYGSIYNMIAASALLLLIINPSLITQVGFQLSYLAVLGIVYYHPKFYTLLEFENLILDKTWSLICVSISAQLATFPLSLYYFHQFPNLFLLTNIIVIPLATLILYLGVAWVALLWLPIVNDALGWLTVHSTYLLNTFVESINRIPFAKTSDLYVSEYMIVLLYSAVFFITLFIQTPGRLNLRLSLTTITFIFGFHLYHNFVQTWYEKTAVVWFDNEPIALRLSGGKGEIYSNLDISESRTNFERQLGSYILSQGVSRSDLMYLKSCDHLHDKETFSALEPNHNYLAIDVFDELIVLNYGAQIDSLMRKSEIFKELR